MNNRVENNIISDSIWKQIPVWERKTGCITFQHILYEKEHSGLTERTPDAIPNST